MSWARCNMMTEFMKKKLCTYIIEHYFGKFLKEKLTTAQLTLNLTNGSACLQNIRVDVQALNKMGENHNLPMEFVDGHIEELQIKIPWRNLLKDSVMVEIRGLNITLQPKQLKEDAASMFESMWTSMTGSLKIVEDLVQQESNKGDDNEAINGVNIMSSTFSFLVRKIRVKFFNTVIQIEHVPKDSLVGVGIIFNIDVISYYDEIETESNEEAAPQQNTENAKKTNVVESFTTKNLNIQGVTISTLEFPSIARTFSRLSSDSEESECDSTIGSTSDESETENQSDNENDDQSKNFIKDVDDNERVDEKQRHAILCAKLTKEIKIKIRLNEGDVEGEPKVAVDVDFGHFILFLSPRQVYLLSELVDGLANPESEDHSNTAEHANYVEKPLTDFDYTRIESYVQQMRSQNQATGGLQGAQGWSEPFPENPYTTEQFYPMNNATSPYASTYGGSLESSAYSVTPSVASTEISGYSRKKSRGSKIGSEFTGELNTFSLQFASFGVILLHEDLLTLNLDGYTLLSNSVLRMQETAKSFFEHIGHYEILDSAETNFDQATAALNKCCKMNHLRILGVPIRLDATEKTRSRSFSITANIEAMKFEFVENLFENGRTAETIPLLRFKRTSSDVPPLVVRLKHKRRTVAQNSRKMRPRTDINIILAECSADIDITIIDRLSALLHSPKVCVIEEKNTNNPWAANSDALNTESQKSVTDLKIQSRYMEVIVRFPLLDFRPSNDTNKTPWWTRNVRPDYLVLSCQDISFQSNFDCEQNYTEFITQCKSITIYYKEAEQYSPVNIARLEHRKREVSEHPRLSIKLFPTRTDNFQEQEDVMTHSMFNPTLLMNLDNGPFTSKKVIHQSNTLYEREQWAGQELIVPGEKEELEEFKKSTLESTKVLVDIMIPSVKMQLASKHLYEIIYNRIINGLLLWEPNDPETKPKFSQYSQTKFDKQAADEFKPMSNAGESDTEEDNASLFYSTYEKPKSTASQASEIPESPVQSKLVLDLKIKEGILSFNTPVRDATSNNVIPEQVGDFLLNIDTATIFIVNSYKGDKDLGYVCVQVENGELWHCAMMSSSNIKTSLPKEKDIGTQLLPTFYKSRKGIMAELQHGNTVRDMLTVACKIATKHETHPVKVLTVSIGANQATLRHRMAQEPNSWVSQMIDFFNVEDHIIPGYIGKEVVAEFHLHMWDCAIDYRPLYLPLRSVITIGSFSMTSNMAEKKSTSIFRFIAQECNLYLSEKEPPKNGVPSIMEVNIRRDFINVVSLGSFDLSLRISDKIIESRPYIDMRIANDCIHIYTCSDSGHALTQLITYLASDGDIKSEENEVNDPRIYTKDSRQDQELICMEQKPSRPIRDITELSRREYEHVDKLLESALYDETEANKTKSSFERSNKTTPTSSVYSASSSASNRRKPLTVEEITRQYNEVKRQYASRSSEAKSQQSSSTDTFASRNLAHSSSYSSNRGSLYEDLSVEELSVRYDAVLNRQHRQIDHHEEPEQNNEDYFNDSPPRIFYLPEETFVEYNKRPKTVLYPQIMKELGDISSLSVEEDISSDFYFIDKEKDLGLFCGYRKPTVRVLTNQSVYIHVNEEYFEELLEKIDKLDTPAGYPVPQYKYTLCKMNIIWHMYGGNDFKKSKNEKKDKKVSFNNSSVYESVNYRNNEEVIFEKKYTPVDKTEFKSWKSKGGVNRDHKVLMELELDKVQFQYDIFSKSSRITSRQILLIHEVEIRDLLAKSEFNKFLYQYTSVDMPREALGQMVLIEATHIRPDKRLPTEECSLRLSLLPLRFNIDQDSLKFLVTFFTELGQETDGDCVSKNALTPKKGINQDPILTVNMKKRRSKPKKKEIVRAPNDNLIFFTDHFGTEEVQKPEPKKIVAPIREIDVDDTNPIFFREIVFTPSVVIKIDYRGKHVELADGSLFSLLVGLIMGLGQFNCSELRLKSICYRKGILGADKVLSFVLQEWLKDVKKNQVPSLLSGIAPLYSIIQLCQGVKDFFWMPIEQYKKDGRIFRGFRKGLNSLSTSTAMATLELTTRFLHLVQFTAEVAYEMLSPNPCVRKPLRIKGRKKRYNQPQDLREGVTNACLLFKHGMGETAETLAEAIRFDSEHMTYSRAVGGVLRQIPPTVLRPIILASEASSNVLGGIKYQLLPDARNEANQKWRCKDD